MFDYRHEADPLLALKESFSRHASGVSVITMVDKDGKPAGLTATSMTSLGATPPLASFNVASGSSSWPVLCGAEYVAIHTLGEANIALRFLDDDWASGPHGVPIFTAATSVLVAKIRQIIPIENNAVVVVDIAEGLVGKEQAGLLYYKRNYVAAGAPIEH